MNEPEARPTVNINLNSILTTLVLGVVGWVGMKTANNADSLTEMKATLPFLNQSVSRVESQLQSLITRSEFENRIAELKMTMAANDKRITVMEIQIKKEHDQK